MVRSSPSYKRRPYSPIISRLRRKFPAFLNVPGILIDVVSVMGESSFRIYSKIYVAYFHLPFLVAFIPEGL